MKFSYEVNAQSGPTKQTLGSKLRLGLKNKVEVSSPRVLNSTFVFPLKLKSDNKAKVKVLVEVYCWI